MRGGGGGGGPNVVVPHPFLRRTALFCRMAWGGPRGSSSVRVKGLVLGHRLMWLREGGGGLSPPPHEWCSLGPRAVQT